MLFNMALVYDCLQLAHALSFEPPPSYLSSLNSASVAQVTSVNLTFVAERRCWCLDVELNNLRLEAALKDTSKYQNANIEVVFTRGPVYRSPAGILCGSASIVIDTSNKSSLRAQGALEIEGETFHLSAIPIYTAWREPNTRPESMPSTSKHKRSLAEDKNNVEMWPSMRDIEAVVNDTGTVSFEAPKIARLGIAADYSFLASFKSLQDACLYIASIVDKASQLWERQFNIRFILAEILLAENESSAYEWNQKCQNNGNSMKELENRLVALSSWRKRSRGDDGLALWTQLTNCPSGDVIGLAWQSTLCESGGANIVRHSLLDYRVLAHEIAHVFGAVHDCSSTTCQTHTLCCPRSQKFCDAGQKFLMNPETTINQFEFSNCTRKTIYHAIEQGRVNSRCLQAPRKNTSTYLRDECDAIINLDERAECLRNSQCKYRMESNQSFFCGLQNSCSLTCYDPQKQSCNILKFPLLDKTPCAYQNKSKGGSPIFDGACLSGGCLISAVELQTDRPLWLWALVAMLSGMFLITGVGIFVLVLNRRNQLRGSILRTKKGETGGELQGLPSVLRHTNDNVVNPFLSERSSTSKPPDGSVCT